VATDLRPSTAADIGRELAAASAEGQSVRIVGRGTKLQWGTRVTADRELHTAGLARIEEHNAGDLTAILEAGVSLAAAQRKFAAAGQMLALDPWLGTENEATVGGVFATADSGPLRHRYGAARDLVLGMTVVLSDGTVARSGGKVIKNVAGYDLAKLFCGSYGTLGLIASVSVRLHPRPPVTATAVGTTKDPASLSEAARGIASAPLELERFDFSWAGDRGTLLAQCGGARAADRAGRVALLMGELGLTETDVAVEDEVLWNDQSLRQRSTDGALVRAAVRPSALLAVFDAARNAGASAVGRAALGQSFIDVAPEALTRLLGALPAGSLWTLADAPDSIRTTVDPWGSAAPPDALGLMRRVKARFDPTFTCNRGLFVGGI
jgi:glycolate oxidase FAD binding subunit